MMKMPNSYLDAIDLSKYGIDRRHRVVLFPAALFSIGCSVIIIAIQTASILLECKKSDATRTKKYSPATV
jgi:hypothetical protein